MTLYFYEISGGRANDSRDEYRKGESGFHSWKEANKKAREEEERMIALGYNPRTLKVGYVFVYEGVCSQGLLNDIIYNGE